MAKLGLFVFGGWNAADGELSLATQIRCEVPAASWSSSFVCVWGLTHPGPSRLGDRVVVFAIAISSVEDIVQMHLHSVAVILSDLVQSAATF